MPSIRDILDKYGDGGDNLPPKDGQGRPEDPTPPEQPEWPSPWGGEPEPEVPEQPEWPSPWSGEPEPEVPEQPEWPSPGEIPQRDLPGQAPPLEEIPGPAAGSQEGEIIGTFGGSRGGSDQPVKQPKKFRGKTGKPAVSGLLSTLPEYWGIDLALILVTLVGVIAILINLNAVLSYLAYLIYQLVNLVLTVGVIAAVAVGAFWLFRRRR